MTNTDYLDAAFKVFEDRLVELEDLVEKGDSPFLKISHYKRESF